MTAPVLELDWSDTETSGLAETVDEVLALDRQIIEYAFATWDANNGVTKSLERKVMPTGDAIADALECASKGYNHFTGTANWMNPTSNPREYVHAAPWSADDCENVHDFLVDGCLAGSNPGFDLNFYKAEFHRLGHLDGFPKLSTHRKCDVGQGAWYLFAVGLVDKTGLVTLASHLGVEHKSHTAMGDVLASIGCFERLVDEYINRPRRMLELLRAIADGGPLSGEEFEELRAEIAALGPGL